MTLIRERDYEDISVQEILDRADVGRSTFYSHYRDKDALLVDGIHDMIRSVSSASSDDLTWFSRPILEHHERHRRAVDHKLTASARAVLHEHLRHVLAQLVRDRLKTPRLARRDTGRMPPALLAAYLSATFVLVLNWWLDSGSSLTAADVHDLFRSLVAGALNT